MPKDETPESRLFRIRGDLNAKLSEETPPTSTFRNEINPNVVLICMLAKDPEASLGFLLSDDARKNYNRPLTLFEDVAWQTRVFSEQGEIIRKLPAEGDLDGKVAAYAVVGSAQDFFAKLSRLEMPEAIPETEFFRWFNPEKNRFELLTLVPRSKDGGINIEKLVPLFVEARNNEFAKSVRKFLVLPPAKEKS
ncbi:Uncharacterised protein [Candidatus Gugararchaeum adminiculabundum]|nr:Uncharacterised protein [Candidatus Gugararchaeum adminiculabundum]